MRFGYSVIVPLVAVVALAGCQQQIPDSGAGVGFGSYDEYERAQAARDAQLAGATALPAPQAVSAEPLAATTPSRAEAMAAAGAGQTGTATTASALAREAEATLAATRANSGQAPLEASPSNPAPETVTAGGLSAENDFSAVGEVRSIEDDKALIAQNRAQYQVIQPGELPARTGSATPNIVQYALSTSHPVGTKMYNRSAFNGPAKYERNCAKYPSPDKAQEEFLASGGPERDRMGIDPDGDGFACSWTPTPFRRAVGG